MEVRKRDSSHLMSEREWEEFWHVLDSNRQRVGRPHALKAPLGPLARAEQVTAACRTCLVGTQSTCSRA